jgi:hypothetical protein
MNSLLCYGKRSPLLLTGGGMRRRMILVSEKVTLERAMRRQL